MRQVLKSVMLAILIGAAGYASAGSEEKRRLASILYDAWDEDIRVDASTMTIVHTQTEYVYDSPISGNPKGSKLLKLLDGHVTEGQVETLGNCVRDARFMELGVSYGAPEEQRYYPYRLEVGCARGDKKVVEYRSSPFFVKAPEGFKSVVSCLQDLSASIRNGK